MFILLSRWCNIANHHQLTCVIAEKKKKKKRTRYMNSYKYECDCDCECGNFMVVEWKTKMNSQNSTSQRMEWMQKARLNYIFCNIIMLRYGYNNFIVLRPCLLPLHSAWVQSGFDCITYDQKRKLFEFFFFSAAESNALLVCCSWSEWERNC